MFLLAVRLKLWHSLFCADNGSNDIVLIGEVLSEWEEVRNPICNDADNSEANRVVKELRLIINLRFNDLEDEASKALEDIVDREWLAWGVVELEAEHLLHLSVDPAVLATPEEAHDPWHPVELIHLNEGDGDAEHCQNDDHIAQNSNFASKSINYPSDEEPTKDLS